MARTYQEIRKTYITGRTEELLKAGYTSVNNWRQAAKDRARMEFDDLVASERADAVEKAEHFFLS